jgi:hypothetical protein
MKISKQIVWSSLLAILTLAGAGCSSKPQGSDSGGRKSETSKSAKTARATTPTDFETGREAFQKVYAMARSWAPDVQPVRFESRPRKEEKHDGTGSVWSGTFASSSRRQIRSYLWSGASADDAPEPGITPGTADVYNEGNASTRPFDLTFLKIDTDKAFAVASKKGGAAVLKKNPDTPVKYVLFWDAPRGRLIWRVIFGQSEYDAKLVVWVNASTGDFVKIER